MKEEKEANAFAMALLMPEKFVLREFEKFFPEGIEVVDGYETEKLEAMANKFKVSTQLLIFRLGQIGLLLKG